MMLAALKLESFGDDQLEEAAANAEYENGYTAGYEAAQQAAAQEADRLTAELVQALSDMSFTYSEARQDFILSLGNLVTALTSSVLPHCVASGFAGQVADLIMQTFASQNNAAIRVNVHPEQVAALTAATDQISALVSVVGDPRLTRHMAWIGQDGTEIQVDMDRHLTEITDLLRNLSPQHNGTAQHG